MLFEFDSYRLRPEALSTLELVIAALTQRPEVGLLIEGHTCNIGTTEYNLALGERRAAEVRDYLVRRGIAPAVSRRSASVKNGRPTTTPRKRRGA